MSNLRDLQSELQACADSGKAVFFPRFFKAGKGEYAEGDKFIGVTVPNQRNVARKYYKTLSLEKVASLITSPIHEYRFTATEILKFKYKSSKSETEKNEIIDFYLDNLSHINNWDLVDNSSYSLLGDWLRDKDKKILYTFARSKNLWKRRIAIVATFRFIKDDSFKPTIEISEILRDDPHDLIQKAVGWMLREVGKRDLEIEKNFLKKHYKKMPRTMLRYSIERFPESERLKYLKGDI